MIIPISQIWKLRLRGKNDFAEGLTDREPLFGPHCSCLRLCQHQGALPLYFYLGGVLHSPWVLPSSGGTKQRALQSPQGPEFWLSAPAGVCLPHMQNCAARKTNYKCWVFIVSFSTQCFQHLEGTIYRILPAPQKERQSLRWETEEKQKGWHLLK